MPGLKSKLEAMGGDPRATTPDEMKALVSRQYETWKKPDLKIMPTRRISTALGAGLEQTRGRSGGATTLPATGSFHLLIQKTLKLSPSLSSWRWPVGSQLGIV